MAQRKINTAWTKGLTGEQKKRFQEQLLSNHSIFERLDKILEESKRKTWIKSDEYVQDWAYYQAHMNGINEAYDNVQQLIRTLIKDD